MGLRYHYAMATGNLGQYRLSLNQVREGERHLKESIELCKALGAVIWHHFVPALSNSLSEQGRWTEALDALDEFDSSQVDQPEMWNALISFQRGICQLGLEDRASAEAAMSAGNALIGELADGHSGEDLWGHPRWYQRRLHDLLEENTPG